MSYRPLGWSSEEGESCPEKVACFRNTTLPSVEYCIDTFFTAFYPDILRKGVAAEPLYEMMPHKEADHCGWRMVRSNPAASIYYKVDSGAGPVEYETIRESANGAIWVLHKTVPWWDLLLAVGIPILLIVMVFIVAVKNRNYKIKARKARQEGLDAGKGTWDETGSGEGSLASLDANAEKSMGVRVKEV